MICAACGEVSRVDPCIVCGQPTLLDDRYCLNAVVGRGAMGTTYKATDPEGNIVAIKEVLVRTVDDDKMHELIKREARVLRELNHPAIPRWIDDFIAGTGKHRALYLVQEFIEGSPLTDESEARRYSQDEVMAILEDLLPVIEYLHDRSPPVIHRDIKPGNVLRRMEDGQLMLVDFGSVRDVLKDPDLGGSTVTGTFGYMAPEQFQGDASPQTDLYGLGALAVALLSRRDPHQLMDHARRLDFADHIHADPEVEDLLRDLLAPDPADRPASANTVLTRVRGIRSGDAALVPVERRPVRPKHHFRKYIILLALLAMVIAAFISAFFILATPTPPAKAPAAPVVTQAPTVPPAPPQPSPSPPATSTQLPSDLPPLVQLQLVFNGDEGITDCLRRHGSDVDGPIALNVSVTPPQTVAVQKFDMPANADALERCLLNTMGRVRDYPELSLSQRFETNVSLVPPGTPKILRSTIVAGSNQRQLQEDVERTLDATNVNRCVADALANGGGQQTRYIGIRYMKKMGDQAVSVIPKEAGASRLGRCLSIQVRDALGSGQASMVEVWWWWSTGD